MNSIEERFLIYEGFLNDIPMIFNKLIDKFQFEILDASIYGIHFANNRCKLDITSETGNLQIWLSIPKYNVSEMVAILSIFKGEEIHNRYRKIRMIDNVKDELRELSEFLCEYFSEELMPNHDSFSK